jgi:hypothetical protein
MSYQTTTYSAYSSTNVSQPVFMTDNNNIIFEFTAINVSNQYAVLPTFDNVSVYGFPNVSAVARFNVSATSLNELFYFQGTADQTIPLRYGMNTSFRFNFSYSNSSVTFGAINNTDSTPLLKTDYVNYIASAITGGYNLADVFANEQALYTGVANMDASFNTNINNTISKLNVSFNTSTSESININNGSVFLDTFNSNSSHIQSIKKLIDGLLSINTTTRGQQFLQDIAEQNTSAINISSNLSTSLKSYYYVRFRAGDIVSIVLNYVPYAGNGNPIIGYNPLYTRAYKIMLLCQ